MLKFKNILLLIASTLIISACKEPLETKSSIKTIAADKNASAPFLFKGNNNTMLNWTEWNKNKSDNELKFAFYNTKTTKFDTAITVTPAKGLQVHAESMAKVGISKNGIIYAVYRRKTPNGKSRFGGHIYYSLSKDMGNSWTKEQQLVTDSTSTSQAFFDLALLPDGELGLIWLDSRKPIAKTEKGKSIYFAKTINDKGFNNEKAIIGSTCECCRTELYIDSNKNINIAYRNLIEKGEVEHDGKGDTEIRDMYYSISNDTGKTFSEPIAISEDNWHINGCPHTGPTLAYSDKELAAVWFTAANDYAALFFTKKNNDDSTFSKRKLLSNKGRHPQMISFNTDFYVVYEAYYEKEEKGYSKIVIKSLNTLKEEEISKPLTNNNHAVISLISSKKAIIAWVNEDTRNAKINYNSFIK